jgi:hypothetical protein
MLLEVAMKQNSFCFAFLILGGGVNVTGSHHNVPTPKVSRAFEAHHHPGQLQAIVFECREKRKTPTCRSSNNNDDGGNLQEDYMLTMYPNQKKILCRGSKVSCWAIPNPLGWWVGGWVGGWMDGWMGFGFFNCPPS